MLARFIEVFWCIGDRPLEVTGTKDEVTTLGIPGSGAARRSGCPTHFCSHGSLQLPVAGTAAAGHPQQATLSSVVELVLTFPDRQDINCRHPGMSDLYLLRVTLRFEGAGALVDSRLEEQVRLGAL